MLQRSSRLILSAKRQPEAETCDPVRRIVRQRAFKVRSRARGITIGRYRAIAEAKFKGLMEIPEALPVVCHRRFTCSHDDLSRQIRNCTFSRPWAGTPDTPLVVSPMPPMRPKLTTGFNRIAPRSKPARK